MKAIPARFARVQNLVLILCFKNLILRTLLMVLLQKPYMNSFGFDIPYVGFDLSLSLSNVLVFFFTVRQLHIIQLIMVKIIRLSSCRYLKDYKFKFCWERFYSLKMCAFKIV